MAHIHGICPTLAPWPITTRLDDGNKKSKISIWLSTSRLPLTGGIIISLDPILVNPHFNLLFSNSSSFSSSLFVWLVSVKSSLKLCASEKQQIVFGIREKLGHSQTLHSFCFGCCWRQYLVSRQTPIEPLYWRQLSPRLLDRELRVVVSVNSVLDSVGKWISSPQ